MVNRSQQAKQQPRGQPGHSGQFVKKTSTQAKPPKAHSVNLNSTAPPVVVSPDDLKEEELSGKKFDLLPDDTEATVEDIRKSRKLTKLPRRTRQGVMPVEAEDLLKAAAAEERKYGFTMSFKSRKGNLEDRIVVPPDEGYCVAIEGTDLHLPPGAIKPDGEPSDEAIAIVRAWLDHLAPTLQNAAVWIGGWRPPDNDGGGERTGLEINLTLVYKRDEEEAARKAAKEWDQEAMWSLHEEKDVPTDGKGGQSWYTKDLKKAYKKAQQRQTDTH